MRANGIFDADYYFNPDSICIHSFFLPCRLTSFSHFTNSLISISIRICQVFPKTWHIEIYHLKTDNVLDLVSSLEANESLHHPTNKSDSGKSSGGSSRKGKVLFHEATMKQTEHKGRTGITNCAIKHQEQPLNAYSTRRMLDKAGFWFDLGHVAPKITHIMVRHVLLPPLNTRIRITIL